MSVDSSALHPETVTIEAAEEKEERDLRLAKEIPKLRADLIIVERIVHGQKRYTIKVPDTETFFLAGESEYLIMTLMNGQRGIPAIARAALDLHGLEVDAALVWKFVKSLFSSECLEVPGRQLRQQLIKERKKSDNFFKNILYMDRHIFNPDKFFDRLLPKVAFFYTPLFLKIVLLAVLLSILALVMNAQQFKMELRTMGSVSGVLIIYFAAAVVTALHEFAHGLTCKYYGGNVPSIGLLLIILTFPCFYTDVSDAWLFKEKKHRLWVTSAGIIFESFLWSLSVGLWLVTEVDSILHQVSLGIMISSAMGMILSMNPLLKFDGYYFLIDLLEIPNLRNKAMAYFSIWLGALFKGDVERLPEASVRNRRIYKLYGLATISLTTFILGGVVFKVGGYLINEYGWIFILPILWFAKLLLSSLFRGIWAGMKNEGTTDTPSSGVTGQQVSGQNAVVKAETGAKDVAFASGHDGPPPADKKPFHQQYRKFIWLAGILFLLSLGYFTRGTLEVSGPLALHPAVSQFAEPVVQGIIKNVHVREGQTVEQGDLLITIDDQNILMSVNSIMTSLTSAEKRLELLQKGTRPEIIHTKQAALEVIAGEVIYYQKAFERLSQIPDSVSKSRLLEAKHLWDSARKRYVVAENELALLLAGAQPEELEAQRAQVANLKAQLEKYKQDLANTKMKAPIAGTIVTKDPERLIGRYTSQGMTLLEIEGTDVHKAKLAIKERDIAAVKLGMPVRFKVYGYPSRIFEGQVTHISSKVTVELIDSLDTSAIIVEASVNDPEKLLKTGMSGEARIISIEDNNLALTFRRLRHWFKIQFWW